MAESLLREIAEVEEEERPNHEEEEQFHHRYCAEWKKVVNSRGGGRFNKRLSTLYRSLLRKGVGF